jgi:DNA-binding transcriptional ArsR family regulator
MDQLDLTFRALSDATRREILGRLGREGVLTVGELATPLAMSLPGVLKHINTLEAAGLVRRKKVGRAVRCELVADPLREAEAWLACYERFWTASLDRLQTYLENDR